LDAGKLGEVGLVRVHRWGSGASGNPMVRDLDLASWLVGKQPNLVYAVGREGLIQVHLGFPEGGMALLDSTDRLPRGDASHSLSVIGSAGAAYADDHQNMQLVYRGGHPQAVRADEGARQFTALIQEFADGVQAGRDLSGTPTSWKRVWAVVAAVERSLQSRQ